MDDLDIQNESHSEDFARIHGGHRSTGDMFLPKGLEGSLTGMVCFDEECDGELRIVSSDWPQTKMNLESSSL